MPNASHPPFSPTPSAIWLLADLRRRLPTAETYLTRLEEMLPVLEEMVSIQHLLALERSLESVDNCVSGVSLDAVAVAPRGWRFWRRGPDAFFLSTLVMSEDLSRNFRGLVVHAQAYLAWTESGRKTHSRAYVDFCMETKALQRFMGSALRQLERIYADLQQKVERARSDTARRALRTVHGKARAVSGELRRYEALSQHAQAVQDAVTQFATARQNVQACLGPDLASHAGRLQHYLDEVDAHDKPATRAEKLERARAAHTHLQVWLEHAGAAIMELHTTQQLLAGKLKAMKQALVPLRANAPVEKGNPASEQKSRQPLL